MSDLQQKNICLQTELQQAKRTIQELRNKLATVRGERDAAQKERDEALAKCAEMREALSELDGSRVGGFQCYSCYGFKGANREVTHSPNCKLDHALSGDCGKHYIRVRELEPTIALLQKVRDHFYDPQAQHHKLDLQFMQELTPTYQEALLQTMIDRERVEEQFEQMIVESPDILTP